MRQLVWRKHFSAYRQRLTGNLAAMKSTGTSLSWGAFAGICFRA